MLRIAPTTEHSVFFLFSVLFSHLFTQIVLDFFATMIEGKISIDSFLPNWLLNYIELDV